MKRYIVEKLNEDGSIKKPNDNTYLVVNTDEPYAAMVYHIIRAEELRKGNEDMPDTFEEFKRKLKE